MLSQKDSLRSAADICLVLGILLLVTHVYFFYIPVFFEMGWESGLTNRILEVIVQTGLFEKAWYSKNLALILLLVASWGAPVRKTPEVSLRITPGILLGGLLIYLFYMPTVDNWDRLVRADLNRYIFCVVMSVGSILFGASRLRRQVRFPSSINDPFGWFRSGFPQEHRIIRTDFSLHLQGEYELKGEKKTSWINLINPRRGVMIMGGPGCGKSYFIIEPLIRQIIEKGHALFVYDFKFDSLSRWVFGHFLANRDRYPGSTKFYCINFTDLSRSHRCNVLQPSTLRYLSDAQGVSKEIFLSMNKAWVQDEGKFFVVSPVNFLAALIWYLRKYRGGRYCTLPHAIELSTVPYEKLFKILGAETELATLVDPFLQAFNNKSMEMLDGQIASAKISLSQLSSPDLYYLLTGDDFTLDINNKDEPKVFCLGGDPGRSEALAPIISLYIDRLARLCNKQGQYPCALVCDEFASVRAYSMSFTIATGRSNNITPILAFQDISQLRTHYDYNEVAAMVNMSGNLFCGQTAGETAQWVSDRFPKVLRGRDSVSVNSNDTNVGVTEHWELSVPQATISTLSSGEFVGVVADEPGKELRLKAFHAKIVREEGMGLERELPLVAEVDDKVLGEHYEKVKREVRELVSTESKRLRINTSG